MRVLGRRHSNRPVLLLRRVLALGCLGGALAGLMPSDLHTQDTDAHPIDVEAWEARVKAKDFQGALKILEPALTAGDLDAKSLTASTFYRAGRFEEARDLFLELIESGHHNPPNYTMGWYWVRLGWCHQALADLEEAGAAYGRAYAEPDVSGHVRKAREGLDLIRKVIEDTPAIDFVEVFGGSGQEKEEALRLSGLDVGAPAFHRSMENALLQLKESGQFQFVDLFYWDEAAGKVGVIIDIVGESAPPPPPFRPPPEGAAVLPAVVMETADQYGQLFHNYRRIPDEENRMKLGEAEEAMATVAEGQLGAILHVLQTGKDSDQVRSAAYVVGYLESGERVSEVVSALSPRFDDPDRSVRNAALRSGGLLEARHGERHGPLVNLDDALRALSRPGVLDRQKACEILRCLARHPRLREEIRAKALPRARAIAESKLSMHRRGGIALLREIAEERRMSDRDWLDWLGENYPDSVEWWKWAEAEQRRQGQAEAGD